MKFIRLNIMLIWLGVYQGGPKKLQMEWKIQIDTKDWVILNMKWLSIENIKIYIISIVFLVLWEIVKIVLDKNSTISL